MPRNRGKVFEDEFKASLAPGTFCYRLPDSASGFAGGQMTRFSLKNPCDFFLFANGILMPIELKTTENTSMNYETEKDKGRGQNIKWHQIEGLRNFTYGHARVRGGFLLQFTNRDKGINHTYWISIGDFDCMLESIGDKKKSFNEKDLKNFRAYEVTGKLIKTRYKYDIASLIKYINTLENIGIPRQGNYKFEVFDPKPAVDIKIDYEALRAMGVDI